MWTPILEDTGTKMSSGITPRTGRSRLIPRSTTSPLLIVRNLLLGFSHGAQGAPMKLSFLAEIIPGEVYTFGVYMRRPT